MGIAETTTTIKRNADGTYTVTTTTVFDTMPDVAAAPSAFTLASIAGWKSARPGAPVSPQLDEGMMNVRGRDSLPNDPMLGSVHTKKVNGPEHMEELWLDEGVATAEEFDLDWVNSTPPDFAAVRAAHPTLPEAFLPLDYKALPATLGPDENSPIGKVYSGIRLPSATNPAPPTAWLWRHTRQDDTIDEIWFFAAGYVRPFAEGHKLLVRKRLVGGAHVQESAHAFLSLRMQENAQTISDCRVVYTTYKWGPHPSNP